MALRKRVPSMRRVLSFNEDTMKDPVQLSPLATALLTACTKEPSSIADVVARAQIATGYELVDIGAAIDELCCAWLIRSNGSRVDDRVALVDIAADEARFEAWSKARRVADSVRSTAERDAQAQWEQAYAVALCEYEAGFVFPVDVTPSKEKTLTFATA